MIEQHFGESTPLSLGVEEEVMLLDPHNGWSLAQRIDDVLPRRRNDDCHQPLLIT